MCIYDVYNKKRSKMLRNTLKTGLNHYRTIVPLQSKIKIHIKPPKSIFDIGSPECHKAVILDNQDLFKFLQRQVVNSITKILEMNQGVRKELSDKKAYITISAHGKTTITDQDSVMKVLHGENALIAKTIQKVIYDKNLNDEYNFVSSAGLQIGATDSSILHKDNGIGNHFKNQSFDYTLLVPVMDYDLSGNNEHNFEPESTKIIPQEFKSKIPGYARSPEEHRGLVFYNEPYDSKYLASEYLVSEKLTKGTAIILHTTESNENKNSKSVIHASPEIPYDYTRCFILVRANKKPCDDT